MIVRHSIDQANKTVSGQEYRYHIRFSLSCVSHESFPIENGLKQGNALSPLPFNFALEFAIRNVQETNLSLDMNGTYQVLVYSDDVNLIGGDIKTIERNADVLRLLKILV